MLDSDTLKPIAFLCAKALQESVLKLNSSDTVYLTLAKSIFVTLAYIFIGSNYFWINDYFYISKKFDLTVKSPRFFCHSHILSNWLACGFSYQPSCLWSLQEELQIGLLEYVLFNWLVTNSTPNLELFSEFE